VNELTRRRLIQAAGGAVTLAALGACSRSGASTVTDLSEANGFVVPTDSLVAEAEAARRRAGQRTVTARLEARQASLDLGGTTVRTWAYGDAVPGPVIRATAGDLVTVQVTNNLPTGTSVHWHGIRLRNDMDGVPGLTQAPIAVGSTFTYSFTAPDPGTYFYHPHSGVQLDRALYGALIVEDPAEPGDYDVEWVVVLDDWVDGTGRTPDGILAGFRAGAAATSSGSPGDTGEMGGMAGMGGMSATDGAAPAGTDGSSASAGMAGTGMLDGGSIQYPYYLVNGRLPAAPVTFSARPGQRARIRFVNAGSDTAFQVALGGHRMTVTHSDGYPVTPTVADALVLGMGERYDVRVTLGDGVFPLVVLPEGKPGQAFALVRTGGGAAPDPSVRPAELSGQVLLGIALDPVDSARLPMQGPDRLHKLVLEGSMKPYHWTINGRSHPFTEPLPVSSGERVRIRIMNRSTMFHPWHVHGHTFAVVATGLRKDTVLIRRMQVMNIELQADNPGLWMTHCHNLYHAESGMMTTLAYQH
jgi:FtsP/CotA-like multicopper oxidase with cupredoxin domain